MEKIIVIMLMTIIFVNGTALVKDSMRYNRRRI
jgi:hypothetical protein